MARSRVASGSSGNTILVVDDQEEILTSAALLLEREGHRVLTADNGESALALLEPGALQLIIVDYFMPGMSGEELIRAIREQDEDVQIILQTGYSGEKPPRDMLHQLAIQGYHDKSEGPDRLLLWVDVALKAASQLKQARETEKLKAQLLANISHELRTPLHVILGYSELLMDDAAEEELPQHMHQSVEGIQRYARTLWDLVNNFLSFARLEAGAMEILSETVHLEQFQFEIEEVMGFLLHGKPVSFVWDVGPDLPPLWADQQKMLLILRNLLANAAKFTEQGMIRVVGETTADGDVRLSVHDTGVGIEAEHLEAIFDLFRQVDGSSTRPFEGAGLGLALVRRLTRMMGGTISVESTFGKGSTFILHFPSAATALAAPHANAAL